MDADSHEPRIFFKSFLTLLSMGIPASAPNATRGTMKSAIRITLFYALFSILWIVSSDKVMTTLFKDPQVIGAISSLKGLFYVLVTSTLLYVMVSREVKRKNGIIGDLDKEIHTREQLIRELHHRIKNNLQVMIGLLNIETRIPP